MNSKHFSIDILSNTEYLSISTPGKNGSIQINRNIKQIAANTDIEAIQVWLAEFADSPHTLRSYRKEAFRLWVWTTRWLGKPLSNLMREDLLIYEAFLRNPHNDWIDPVAPKHGKERRLFAGPLSESSIRQAMGILSNLFNYLVTAGYLATNPLALRRQRRSLRRTASIERYLDQSLWQFVLSFIESLPQQSQRECQYYERVRWLFRLLYNASLRASEVAQAKACDLTQRRGRWWLRVQGKGNIQADVPISEALIADYARYRQFYDLPAWPNSLEQTPLIMSIAGRADQPLTATMIYLIVKKLFRDAAQALAATDCISAAKLNRASTHWLRHTSATHQADAGNDIRHIQKNLRHASIETTAIYLHAEDDKRHAQTTGQS